MAKQGKIIASQSKKRQAKIGVFAIRTALLWGAVVCSIALLW